MKRFFILLSSAIIAGTLLFTACNEETDEKLSNFDYDFQVDNIYYSSNYDSTEASIVKVSESASGQLVIPEAVTNNGNTYTVTGIYRTAFNNCSKLTGVTLPNTVNLGYIFFTMPLDNVTQGKDNNETVSTGGTVINGFQIYISNPFQGCNSLTSITVNGSNPFYTSIDGMLYSKSKHKLVLCPAGKSGSISIQSTVDTIGSGAFSFCTNLSTVTVHNNIKYIEEGAFYKCDNLSTVNIGNGIKLINHFAFNGCTDIKTLYCMAAVPPSVSSSAFDSTMNKNINIFVPCGKKTAYDTAAVWKNFTNIKEDCSIDGFEK